MILLPISFNEVHKLLPNSCIEIQTLGGRSKIKVEKSAFFIKVTNSKHNLLNIDERLWNKVLDRMSQIPNNERGMTSRYALGNKPYNWKKCPNKVFALYIPAIIKYLTQTHAF
jgi:hypothetical protein